MDMALLRDDEQEQTKKKDFLNGNPNDRYYR